MMNLIFDLDGCLVDSSEVQKAAFFESYAEVVGDDNCPKWEEYIKYTGTSVDNVMKKLNLPAEMATAFRRISRASVDKIRVNWDAINLIKDARKHGSKIAIVTGKDHDRTEDILKYYGIGELFDVLVCADDTSESKPSPIPVLKALELLKAEAKDAIMIGDGYSDILSARGAGVKSILTLWYGDEGVPREADYVVESVEELKGLFIHLAKQF